MKKLTFLIFLISLVNCNRGDGDKLFSDPGFIFGANALFRVFWSDPGISRETAVDKGIDYEWVKFINEAEDTLDIAVYNLGREVIIDAIINARAKGVKIRMVGDVDEAMTRGYQTILRTDIPFSLGNPSGIQHNKFAVRDGKYTIIGTGNLTDTDLMLNNNNYAIMESRSIAESYKDEFEQMFFGRFAKRKEPKTSNRFHTLNGIQMELFFSPYNGVDAMNRLIELVDSAKSEIHFMIFAMTHDELTTALIRAANRGVKVQGIHDFTFIRGTAMVGSRIYQAGRFNPNGPFNKEDGNENTKVPGLRTSGGKLHCKTMIIDRRIVSTGSFNWSNNAVNNNDENMLIIDSPWVAAELMEQWDGIWNVGRPITNQITMNTGDQAQPGDVVFSEVLWAGSYRSGATGGSPARTDSWFELYNTTDRPIDISNWVITWDPDEIVHFQIPDRFSWFEPGVHKLHRRGRMIIDPKGYFLIKNSNNSLPVFNPTAFDNDAADLRISGTKNFRLSSSFMDLKLYDLSMNLIDRAGNGEPPAAGVSNPEDRRTHSMERFFYPNGRALPGEGSSSWYTSNGNNRTGSGNDALRATGRMGDDHAICTTSGDNLNKGCTIGTPTSAIRNNFPANPSIARDGIVNQTNVPIDAYSINGNTAAVRMRWAMTNPPSITGASSIQIDSNDPGLLIIGRNQNPGELITLDVHGNGLDITNSTAEGGNISFTGFGLPKAEGYIKEVWPGQSGSRDKVVVEITQGGSAKGMGIYYYDSTTLATPSMVYTVGDIQVQAGDLLRIQMNTTNILSDDKRIGENPTINKTAGSTPDWDFFSDNPGIPSTDAIVLLGYGANARPIDVMCYSNRNGSIAVNLVEWGFRYLHNNPDLYQLDNIFPVKDFNDFEIQDRCADYRDGGNNRYLTRVARNRNGNDFNYGN
ncbi:MAG: lamin tail domain-containing protein [Leptospira sp.]|nr:lamin tail domain-containing protein [Leptospira sp.]